MEYFGVWNSKDVKIKDYSWGMKNRLNLIICFLKQGEIIIMDEQGANLDSKWRKKVINLLDDLKKQNKTLVLTAHNIDEIASLIDHYIIIDDGAVVFDGSSKQLDIYLKYKIYVSDYIDIAKLRDFMDSKSLKMFDYDESENSVVFAVNDLKDINWVFLYFVKEGTPVTNIKKLPVNMEAIFKAIADANKRKKLSSDNSYETTQTEVISVQPESEPDIEGEPESENYE
ncbi:ABC transporter ATP-binding protein [Spiroplasma clarkii]|nr:ABC transporter ATP-binding protein [Spiroplasma clarkii]